MNAISNIFTNLNKDEKGQTATEYVAVLVVSVGLAIGVLWFALSGMLDNVVSQIGSNLSSFSDSTFGN
jgi:Flp pilus assembly pilin Flp